MNGEERRVFDENEKMKGSGKEWRKRMRGSGIEGTWMRGRKWEGVSEIERGREREMFKRKGKGWGWEEGVGRCEREGVGVRGNFLKDNFIFPLPFSKMVVPITVGGSENNNSQISGLCKLAYEPTEYVVKSTGFMGQTQVLPIVMWVKKSRFIIHAVR